MSAVILASASPSRRSLLEAAGLVVAIRPHGIDERALERTLGRTATPRSVALALAAAKAGAVSRGEPGALVIGADQTLDLDGHSLAKPADRAEAARQLRRLSGRAHTLHAAFALARDGRILARQARTARLAMRRLPAAEIEWYLDVVGAAALASVGGYQIEGLGIRLFERIEGDIFTILGLPLLPLLKALRGVGALSP